MPSNNDVYADIDQEIIHYATDAKTADERKIRISCDYHGLTISLPGGQNVILDLEDNIVGLLYQRAEPQDAERLKDIHIL